MLRFSDVVGDPALLMGTKAVWGVSRAPVMCFGSRGDADSSPDKHFMVARSVAERGTETPFLVTIGGGRRVPPELDGRVLEVARVTGVWGDTATFVGGTDVYPDLEEWPVAVVLSEVYRIEGQPHLLDDLGFSDRSILMNAFDGVIRREPHVQRLWEALADRPVEQRRDLQRIAGFRDPSKVVRVGTNYPRVTFSSTEGKKLWKLVQEAERDRRLSREVKRANHERNGGIYVCEACDLADEKPGIFDAHHLEPLACGVRESRVDDFALLCPTCHRFTHLKTDNPLEPLSVEAIQALRRGT